MSVIVKPENGFVGRIETIGFYEMFDAMTKGISGKKESIIHDILFRMLDTKDKTIKVTARCRKEHVFDEEFGRKLVDQRFYLKKHKKIAKCAIECANICISLSEEFSRIANEHINKMKKINEDIDEYFIKGQVKR